MKSAVIAAIVAAIISASGGYAAGLSQHEQRQNMKLAEVRATAKATYKAERFDDFRLDLIACGKRQGCIGRVTLAYYNSEPWPGWEFAR